MAYQPFVAKEYTAGMTRDEQNAVWEYNKSQGQIVFHNNSIRKLTPTECEKLQTVPINYTKAVSDTQRYKQMGNAVTVNVIEAIGRKILHNHGRIIA